MGVDLNQIGGWVVALLVAVIAGAFALFPKKGSLEHQMLDQLQEEVKRLTDRVDALEGDRERREAYIRRLERRDRAWAERDSSIRIGLANGTMPPLPGLASILEEDL